MARRVWRFIGCGAVALGLAVLGGCAQASIGGQPDAGMDAAVDAAPVHPEAIPGRSFTAGGASVSSENYRLRLFVAPAQPTGRTRSASYRLQLGPTGSSGTP